MLFQFCDYTAYKMFLGAGQGQHTVLGGGGKAGGWQYSTTLGKENLVGWMREAGLHLQGEQYGDTSPLSWHFCVHQFPQSEPRLPLFSLPREEQESP